MALTLLAGPANAGKVALLLERYRAELDLEPVLIVPNRSDVERVERELLRAAGCLMAGSIGTFDDLFERVAREGRRGRVTVTELQRTLLVRRLVERNGNGHGPQPPAPGLVDSLSTAIAELEAGLAEPEHADGELARLYAAYRAELERLGVWDRELRRRYAAERVASELEAWDGRPVFAYGFEDLTGAQWALLDALAGRTDVTVSLPYEPARAAFASLARTASDLACLAGPRVEELPARGEEFVHPALAYLERNLFGLDEAEAATNGRPAPVRGAVRFLEAAGRRNLLELVGDEILALARRGVALEEIAIICPSLERWRAPLDTALGTLGVPFALEGRIPLRQTPYGQALLGLLRFEWLGGGRRDLFAYLRSPFSGLARPHVDFLEGRLRGRAVRDERVEEECVRLRGGPLPGLEPLRSAPSALAATREISRAMLRAAHGIESPPVGDHARLDLRAYEEVSRVVDELEGWLELGGVVTPETIVSALERADVWLRNAAEPGRVAVVDLLRARTRRCEIVFLLGLEQGSLPRRGADSPLLDGERRRAVESRSPRVRLRAHDPIERDRYLFYTACTRASKRLYLAREAATDDGMPREPSPFWDEVRSLFAPDEVERWTTARPLSELVRPLERAPSERERLRAMAALAPEDGDGALAVARANGWERRLERARAAFDRPTRLVNPLALEGVRSRTSFAVTELEAFADCSSIWFIDRIVSPRSIDAEVDARLRGSVAHRALHRFFVELPKRLGVEQLDAERLDDAVELLRECVADAVGRVGIDLSDLQRHELEQGLVRDLERFARNEVELGLPLVPRRFEVSFGSDRSPPELQAGLDLGGFTVSGKIDRVDVDPFSARGIVQDYKSGRTAHSAAKIESELRLQIPLYVLVLRDLIGIEPLGGLYRALGASGQARGLLRASARADALPGLYERDYLDEAAFWSQVERAQELARGFAARIRSGDVRHDPRGGGGCHSWCELAPMCRVARP
jgi:ATP-dependent helicase/nuclease subunit B